MIVTYRPDGEAEQTFEFDPDRVRVKRAEAIEKNARMTWEEWNQAVLMGSAAARRVLLWHLLSLTHPTLRLADTDFAMHEVTVEMTLPELLAMREQVAGSNRVTPEEREQVLQVVDADIEIERAKLDAQDAVRDLAASASRDMAAAYTAVAGAPQTPPDPGDARPMPYDGGDLAVDGLGKVR
ncbi:MAG TPA: hypothetical protein VFX16_21125 [Pseudonocardiaceae bacterium]|nr:hypothetical protein [Pseudonocardiaceae bacterium]